LIDRRALRARANRLKPQIVLGRAGLTPAAVANIRSLLEHQELVKVRFPPTDREAADALAARIAIEAGGELLARTGFTATIHRSRGPADSEQAREPV